MSLTRSRFSQSDNLSDFTERHDGSGCKIAQAESSKGISPLKRSHTTKAQTAVQKIQIVVQKKCKLSFGFECKLSFSFECASQAGYQRAPEYSPSWASKHKENEKVRSMPWKTGTRCPLP
jgi:hypothetical protein